jgi:hypothetical protein
MGYHTVLCQMPTPRRTFWIASTSQSSVHPPSSRQEGNSDQLCTTALMGPRQGCTPPHLPWNAHCLSHRRHSSSSSSSSSRQTQTVQHRVIGAAGCACHRPLGQIVPRNRRYFPPASSWGAAAIIFSNSNLSEPPFVCPLVAPLNHMKIFQYICAVGNNAENEHEALQPIGCLKCNVWSDL